MCDSSFTKNEGKGADSGRDKKTVGRTGGCRDLNV